MEKDRPELLFKFAIRLHSSARGKPSLLFHRWFPEGEKDSINLPTGDPSAALKVWFDPQECFESDLGEAKLSEKEIPQIGVIGAGPLRGLLELSGGFSSEELETVTGNRRGPTYHAFGKRIVNHLIAPPVIKFLTILRVNYGQYWIEEFDEWNSDEDSLGQFCRTYLNLKWSVDGGRTWTDFLPDDPEIRVDCYLDTTGASYKTYLTKDAWDNLKTQLTTDYKPTLAATLLSRAHQSADSGNLSEGFIIGVTALEVAVADLLESFELAKDRRDLESALVLATSNNQTISKSDKTSAIEAIRIRHKIVHDGWLPFNDKKNLLHALLKVTASLLPGPEVIFPSAHHGNLKMPVEKWDGDS